jgi:hypothetical protein
MVQQGRLRKKNLCAGLFGRVGYLVLMASQGLADGPSLEAQPEARKGRSKKCVPLRGESPFSE